MTLMDFLRPGVWPPTVVPAEARFTSTPSFNLSKEPSNKLFDWPSLFLNGLVLGSGLRIVWDDKKYVQQHDGVYKAFGKDVSLALSHHHRA